MQKQAQQPVAVLGQAVTGQHPMDGEVVSSVAVLAERLQHLREHSAMFEAVCFSPDVEAMMAAAGSTVMN